MAFRLPVTPEPQITELTFQAAVIPAMTPIPNQVSTHNQMVLGKSVKHHHVQVHDLIPAVVDGTVVNINRLGIHLPTELVDMIVHYLRFDRFSLARLMRVSKDWFAHVALRLWLYGDPQCLALFVESHIRRSQYASLIRTIKFWSHEKFWDGSSSSRPVFANIQNLELFDIALRNNPTQDLIPFLSPSLRRLVVYSQDNDFATEAQPGEDDLWLSHLGASCKVLREIFFDFEIALSQETFTKFFASSQSLKQVRLSGLVNSTLNDKVIKAVFGLPNLQLLKLDFPMTLATVSRITTHPAALAALTISFSEGAGLAPSILLDSMHSIQHLDISLGNSTNNWFYDLSKSVFRTLGQLKSLRTVVARLHPGLHVTDDEVLALAGLKDLQSLEISEMLVFPDPEPFDHEDQDGSDPLWKSALQVTAKPFLRLLESLDRLEYLHFDLLCDPILTNYDDAIIIDHLLSRLRNSYLSDLALIGEEADAPSWPTEEDWEFALPPDVWLPTNAAFHPDPSIWQLRNLNHQIPNKISETDEGIDSDGSLSEIEDFSEFEDDYDTEQLEED